MISMIVFFVALSDDEARLLSPARAGMVVEARVGEMPHLADYE